MELCSNVGNSSVAWCLERKIPVGRRPLGFGGSLRRSSFSGDEEQTPSLYLPHPPGVERDRSLNSGNFILNPSGWRADRVLHIDVSRRKAKRTGTAVRVQSC